MKRTVQACLLLLPLLVSFSLSQQLNPLGSLEVIDATGKRVGSVVSLSGGGHPRVALQANGSFVHVRLNADRFIGFPPLFFEDSDCSGRAFFRDSIRFLPDSSVLGEPQTLYVEDLDAVPATYIPTESVYHGDTDTCINSSSTLALAMPALPLIDLANEFTPPFKVVAETVISTPIPASAPTGTQIKLVGKGFSVGNAEVMFNGTAGLDVEVINDTVLLVTVPTLPLGPVDITVTTSGGRATLPGGPGGFKVPVFTAAIPTLLEWGAGLLMMGLLGAGLHYLRTGRIAE